MSIINTQKIKVPIDGRPPFEYIVAKQGEIGSRRVEITLTENNKEYTIPSDVTARVKYYKPDGNKVINDCTISQNKIIVTYTEQMLTAAGTGFAEIALYSGNSVLVSATFYTKIVPSVYEAEGLISDSEYLSLNKVLIDTTQARDAVQNAKTNAEVATEAANAAAIKASQVLSLEKGKANGLATLDSEGKLEQMPSAGDVEAISTSEKGKSNGVATLDSEGKLAQMPSAGDVGAISTSEKGKSNGVATLDSEGKLAQMPSAGDVGAVSTSEKGEANGVATLNSEGKLAQMPSAGDVGAISTLEKGEANGIATLNSNAKLDESKLDDSCVTTSKLDDYCVATSKIASNAITIDKTDYINAYPLNLFNPSDIIENGYYNENGIWVSNTGLISSGLIPVTPGLPYTSSRYGLGTIATFWKEDGTFLIGYKYSSNFTYTIAPQGSVYVRFSFATTDENKSVYQNKYIPNDFEYKIDDEIKINNNNIAKEGLSSDKLDFTEHGEDNLYNPDDIITGGYYESTGVWTAGTGMISTGLIPVTPGLPYTASNAITGCVTTFWDSSKNFISGQRAYGSVGYVLAPANSKYLRTSFAVSAINKKVVQGKVCPSVCYGSDKILIPNLRVTSDNVSNGWKNKKWVSYGDSITWYGYWQPDVAEEFGLFHTNLGVSGSCIAGTAEDAMWQESRLNAVKNANPDVITILGGANDMYQSLLIGDDAEFSKELSSKNTSVFKGAYSYIIESLLTWKPTLKVFLLTTTWGKLEYNDATTGLNYRDFAKATKEIAWYYGLPCIDLRGEMGLNAMTASTYLMDDGYNIHPNDAGAKRMARVIIGKLKALQ